MRTCCSFCFVVDKDYGAVVMMDCVACNLKEGDSTYYDETMILCKKCLRKVKKAKNRVMFFKEFKEEIKKLRKKSDQLRKEMGYLVFLRINVYLDRGVIEIRRAGEYICIFASPDVVSINPFVVDLVSGECGDACSSETGLFSTINFRDRKILGVW